MVATLATALGFIMASVTAFAHHGTNISYDSGHLIILKATVMDFRFANPHARIFFDVTNDKDSNCTGPDSFLIDRIGSKRTTRNASRQSDGLPSIRSI